MLSVIGDVSVNSEAPIYGDFVNLEICWFSSSEMFMEVG